MKIIRPLVISLFSFFCLAKTAEASDIFVEKGDASIKIKFSGDISKKDADDLSRMLAQLNSTSSGKDFINEPPISKFFVIDSPGGDVEAAMRIGKLVRGYRMLVVVPMDARCFSSCVYIAAGGVMRWLYGDIGIHRPYFVTAPSEHFDAAIKKLITESKAYFSSMNVSEQLADAMFATPPSEVHVLSDRELASYWLGREDIAYAEGRDIENAARLKISRQEYMKREKLAAQESNRKCTIHAEIVACMNMIYRKYGLMRD